MNIDELIKKEEISEVINKFSNLEINVKAQSKLFTPNVQITIHADNKIMMQLHNREEMVTAFSNAMANAIKSYHMNGQQVIELIDDSTAKDTHYCEATILNDKDGKQTLNISKIRYIDTLVYKNNKWLISNSEQYIVFTEEHELH